MGLWDFLFGPRVPPEEEVDVSKEEPKQYGHLAEREKLLESVQRHAAEREQREEEERRAGGTPHLWGFERSAGRLGERVREAQLPRWHKVTGKLKKLERKLGEAETPEEIRSVARRAVQPRGLFQKIERGMEKRLKDVSPGERRRYEWDLHRLERRLRSPSRYLRT